MRNLSEPCRVAPLLIAAWFCVGADSNPVSKTVTEILDRHVLPTAKTSADHGELLRTIGFSSAPGLLRVFGVITPITGAVFVICTLWMLVAMVVAVRQALDYQSTLRAVAVCAIGFPVYALGLMLSILLLGPWPI